MVRRLSPAITKGGGRLGLVYLLALAAATGGVIALVIAFSSQQSAPQPPASAAGRIVQHHPSPAATPPASAGAGSSTAAQNGTHKTPLSLPASVPAAIDIPAIGVHSDVISIGKAPDGTLAVPQPGPDLNKAAWYENSPTPGQAGPSVIEGHIDSVYGPSVFFQLGAVRPGDQVKVTRQDHSVAVFTVNAVRSYASHDRFPTTVVYGADLSHPTLRLITCSNFDSSTGHYVGNTVVFAHLTSVVHG
ncbi:MAG: class F sortase [Nocardioidaceae bacterium]